MNVESFIEAKQKLLTGDYSVSDFFRQNESILEYAYCLLLLGKVEEAKKEFMKVSDFDFRANWAEKLIQFIQGYVKIVPSYFQIRNFLEIDLNLLLQAGQAGYVEYVINGADLFYSVNPESYKFISRVMLNNNYTEIALHYLSKARDKFYNDPEMHLMLANCYFKMGDKQQAKISANNCLNIFPEYFPARRLLQSIE